MSRTPRLNLIGLYLYDQSIFDNLTLPEGIDHGTAVSVLMMQYGECPLIYPSLPFMRNAIKVWSDKWYASFERILTAIEAAYNPIHNFDRYEDYTDEESRSGSTSGTSSGTDMGTETRVIDTDTGANLSRSMESENSETTDRDTTTERLVSAMNESTYQPDSKEIGTDDGTIERSGSEDTTESATGTEDTTDTLTRNLANSRSESGTSAEDRTLQHTAHLYGNIGVTTSQSMLIDEIALRKDYNIYDIIAEVFRREFCLYLY